MDATPHTHTPTAEVKPKPARARKAKPTGTPTGKRSLNLSLPPEDHERLAVHALRMDITISELVCRLGREHLREYHISRTPGRAGEPSAGQGG